MTWGGEGTSPSICFNPVYVDARFRKIPEFRKWFPGMSGNFYTRSRFPILANPDDNMIFRWILLIFRAEGALTKVTHMGDSFFKSVLKKKISEFSRPDYKKKNIRPREVLCIVADRSGINLPTCCEPERCPTDLLWTPERCRTLQTRNWIDVPHGPNGLWIRVPDGMSSTLRWEDTPTLHTA